MPAKLCVAPIVAYIAAPEASSRRFRQQHSLPVLNALKAWLDNIAPKIVPYTKLGDAVSYTLTYTKKADRASLGIRSSRRVSDQIENEISRTRKSGAGKIANNTDNSDS